MEGVDWSELPPELIDMVARKITIYADYIRFGAVCVKWSSSLSSTPHHLPPQFPWLLLSSSEIPSNQIDFFNLLENKVHHLDLQEISSNGLRSYCCGSSLGWLILHEKSSNTIINPLTRVQIQLPPFVVDSFTTNVLQSLMKKVVLSSNPMSQDFVAVTIFSLTGELGFYKKGDESWTFIEDARSYTEDVIYYNNSFYAVNIHGSLAICDVINGVPSLVSTIEPPPPESVYISDDFKLYLVNSFGELLLVFRYFSGFDDPEFQPGPYETTGFDVYRFDPSEQKWEPVSSLDDRMLFVGHGYSSPSLLATDFSGCEGNCIYFTDHQARTSENGNRYHYMGVYDLANGSIQWIPMFSTMSYSDPVPIWFTPNPCKLESSKSI